MDIGLSMNYNETHTRLQAYIVPVSCYLRSAPASEDPLNQLTMQMYSRPIETVCCCFFGNFSQQEDRKTTGFFNEGVKVQHGPRTNRFNLGMDRKHGADTHCAFNLC